ncbi:MAG TPA: hypothetical protein VLQ80_28945 [Candidatus Saccharimonadia bacterium]|nr:hypothetical protein [Candidatus Saccharimonadia bacterium]
MTLDAVACLRQFLLLHVLPRGFKRMRDDGFCAHGVCPVKLPLCRRVLGKVPVRPLTVASSPPLRPDGCPACYVGRRQVRDAWFP